MVSLGSAAYRRYYLSGCPTEFRPDSCAPGNLKVDIPQWVFYLLATVFDVITIILTTVVREAVLFFRSIKFWLNDSNFLQI